MPTLGAKNGVKLYDMIGLDYNDPKWDELLDQMTFDEMNSLITGPCPSRAWKPPAPVTRTAPRV